MKEIRGHKSWNMSEVLEFMRTSGSFCVCMLPHYRYDGVKGIYLTLKKHNLVEKSGSTDVGVNIRPTWLLKMYFRSQSKLGPVKWAKLMSKYL